MPAYIFKLLTIFCCLLQPAFGATVKVKIIDGEKEQLVFDILELALSHSAPGTTYVFDTTSKNEAQMMADIDSGALDVMWSGAAQEKDDAMMAVRIPVLKGLLGHRIFIIRDADKQKFASIRTMQDLKQFYAGQGTFWGDSTVLKNADIPLVTTIKYANLFPMLEGGRFDYFPRAVHEPWVEVESRPELNLAIDSNVMLIYPYAMYFYVKKDNQALHDLIHRGFDMAIADGSFDKLFFSHPMIQDVMNNAHLSERTVFRISNPTMHKDTPLDVQAYWLDVSKH